MTTAYHAQYWAYALTIQSAPDSVQHLSRAISNARVDLNPHQVEAALFALQSPLSSGTILADEVGLGKTIEAALVISQRWAERKRHILIVVPAALRTQWQQELLDKFFLPSLVLERRAWNKLQAKGTPNPFDIADRIVICSYHFAAANTGAVASVPWDLVVIDEAHRLRNVYKPKNKTAKAIAEATAHAPKLLLTATPLQNSLMELFGLVSVIDPHVFGDQVSFREQFIRQSDGELRDRALRARLDTVCHRTLRKHVLEYVKFTQRTPVTQEFYPTDYEHRLYEQVSEYLRREVLYALPSAQRHLMTMVLRKLLASSSFAISATLEKLLRRLKGLAAEAEVEAALESDFEVIDEVEEEWSAEQLDSAHPAEDEIDPAVLAEEIKCLADCVALAKRIHENTKGEALLRALSAAFDTNEASGAPKKAVVFTESRRTQDYLVKLLSEHGHDGQTILLNGTNTDELSREIHARWLERHSEDGVPTGARAVDVRAAIVEEFRDSATVLVATEAAAEGINLQFCSLVINYDLPWNPQRVEQRIGRCHRYGQLRDVVVVNFLNERNAADRRVLDLLSEKFQLFDGVFGASDEILGAIESGVDIERRISAVYQTCRTTEEIDVAFDELRDELEEEITSRMTETRQRLLDHFDEDVQTRLRVHRDEAQASLDERGRMLLNLTRYELDGSADFDTVSPRFHYRGEGAPHGCYCFDWRDAERERGTFYRVDHPLAAQLIERARTRDLLARNLEFAYAAHQASISILDPYTGQDGWLTCGLLTVESVEDEEFLIFAARADSGDILDAGWCRRLLRLPASDQGEVSNALDLGESETEEAQRCLGRVEVRNGRYFDAEVTKLDRWSDDLKLGLERELKDLDQAIRDLRRQSATAVALADKLEAQRGIKAIERKRNGKRRDLFEEQDNIDEQRSELIAGIERQLFTTHHYERLFSVRWTLR